MASKNSAARSLESLEEDIRRLRHKAKDLEDQLDENFKYFTEHSGSMFVRSLLPRTVGDEAVTGNPIIDPFLRNEKLQKILAKLGDYFAERLGDGLNWVINRVFKK